jgi:regulator of cell morphogenesis and NO signaling
MSRFHPTDTVARIVATSPPTSRVFEKLAIDYCCGGGVSLADACTKRGLAVATVIDDLERAGAASGPAEDLSRLGMRDLVDRILSVHHTFVKREIPRLSGLVEKVVRAHGANHPALLPPLARLWAEVAPALSQHLEKEEEMLFPWIVALDERRLPAEIARSLDAPIEMMEAEHDEAGGIFARMRALANGYVAPADACGSWRALWSGLDEFELDLHRHVHLENHLLFPLVRERMAMQPV